MEKTDYRQTVTNKIVELMEKGNLPLQNPWDGKIGISLMNMPHNAVTGRPYQGGNADYLAVLGIELDDGEDPRWCTFKQAKKKGWHIKKGSKSAVVEYWEFYDREVDANGVEHKLNKKKAKVFYANVFHASQIEGIPPYEPKRGYKGTPIECVETILKESHAKIYQDQGNKAFYTQSTDEIHLPCKEAFPKIEGYYAVVLHELGHWTGHPSRLNRNIENKFGSADYAIEELRAEMASVYLSIETGVPFEPKNHAAYTKRWIKELKNDKNLFFKAARDAEKIADYVMELAYKKEKAAENKIQTSNENVSINKIIFEDKNKTKYEMNSLLAAEDFVSQASKKLEDAEYKVTVVWASKEIYKGAYQVKSADSFKYKPFEMHLSNALSDKDYHELLEGVKPEIAAYLDLKPYRNYNARLDAISDVKESAKGIQSLYKQEVKKLLKHACTLEEIDKQVIEVLYMKNAYSLSKIKETITKCSPNASVLEKEYADKLVKKSLTPEMKNKMKQNQLSVSC